MADVPAGITDWASRGTASQTIGPAYRCGAVWNSAHWCDERFERLMHEFDGELDVQRRRRLAADAAQIQHDAVPAVIAYWIDDLRALAGERRRLATGRVPTWRRCGVGVTGRTADVRRPRPSALPPPPAGPGAPDAPARLDAGLRDRQLLPGDPGRTILGPYASEEQVAALNDQLGADDPAPRSAT